MKRILVLVLLTMLLLSVASGCASASSAFTPAPTQTETELPTAASTPSPTFSPTPAATATAAPTPTLPPTPSPTPGGPTATIRGVTFSLELAVTEPERELGLSYRASMARDHGMLFVYPPRSSPGFWMKGMEFSLDMLWIKQDGTLADITHDAIPQPGVPDPYLTVYQPSSPVTYVMEINAGLSDHYGFHIGDHVSFQHVPGPSGS